ncbi:MAG: DnaD domain protein, partial [Oscillospiraceae bacterium]|nr:DnaD domain protein [Oscillospiraceae bacterium]
AGRMSDAVPEKPVAKRHRHMSQNQIAVALLGNEEYAVLLQESQRLLGRELSISESRLLIETVTEYGTAVPSLLMLESYWLNTEPVKNVLSRTASTAKEWSELGIRTLEEAEAALTAMENRYSYAKSVASLMKTDVSGFTRKERRLINTIFEDFGYDESFVSEVLTRNPEANLPYISSVLKDWHKKGYKTISDVRLLSSAPSVPVRSRPADDDGDSLFWEAVRKINEEE